MRFDPTFSIVLSCFALSGFSGLLYETVWARQFALVFGTSEPAVATVLAAYMGGLALGASLARNWVLRVRRVVWVYGLLELGIGVAALAVPYAIRASTVVCVALFGEANASGESTGLGLTLFYFACSSLILLVPTALMGATLPLLARISVRHEREISSRIGLLYSTNTAGAVLGTLCAAFVLMPRLGLRGTIFIGVAANLLVFGLATLCPRGSRQLPHPRPVTPHPVANTRGRPDWILLLMLLSGITSFTYEVLWTRLLGHVFGGTVYAFSTMLASFLTGIALGSALASRAAADAERALHRFAVAQLGVAICSLGAFLALNWLPSIALVLGAGSRGGLAANSLLAGFVLLPGALFIGATFPLAVRILSRDDVDASPASARVYAWNTVGGILGAVGAGFVWLPAIGYEGSLVAAVVLNLGLAAAAALLAQRPRRSIAAVAAVSAVALILSQPSPPWRLLMTSPLDLRAGIPRFLFPPEKTYFAVGRSATVLLLGEDAGWSLRTNGLPEAGMRPRGWPLLDGTPQWLGALPTLARPSAKSMLVIGLGGGSAIEAVPSSVESITVIELEPEVLAANRRVSDGRARDPLADPRVRVQINDARGALLLSNHRYDAIVSQPSHPWTAGASHLFTAEFFELVGDHLTPNGVFVQWMGLSFVDESLFRGLVATLNSTFEYVRIYWLRSAESVLCVASSQPLPVEETAAQAIAESPEAYVHLGLYTPEDLAAMLILDEEGSRSFAASADVSTDDRNLFQMRSPGILGAPIDRAGMEKLIKPFDALRTPAESWDRMRLGRRLVANGDLVRAARLAEGTSDPLEYLQLRGFIRLARGENSLAEADLREALRLQPDSLETRAALARIPGSDSAAGAAAGAGAETAQSLPTLDAVVHGWRLAARGDWKSLERLENPLVGIAPEHPLYRDSLSLRARWRIQSGRVAAAREAISLIDRLLPLQHQMSDLILRARALAITGQSRLALATLAEITKRLGPTQPRAKLLQQVIAALSEIPDDDALLSRRNALAVLLDQRLNPSKRHP